MSYFSIMLPFYTPWKHQRNSCFLMFSRGIKTVVFWCFQGGIEKGALGRIGFVIKKHVQNFSMALCNALKNVKTRSNYEGCFIRKAVLKNLPIFTGKHLYLSLFLIKFIKKWLQRRCFSVNIAKFLRTSIIKNICKRLLLNVPKPLVFYFFAGGIQRDHSKIK